MRESRSAKSFRIVLIWHFLFFVWSEIYWQLHSIHNTYTRTNEGLILPTFGRNSLFNVVDITLLAVAYKLQQNIQALQIYVYTKKWETVPL